MRKYELITIFDPSLTEENLQKDIKKIETLLAGNKAQNVLVDNWGRKELSGSFAKCGHGYYVAIKFESDNHEIVDALNTQLRITETIIKFQTHRLNEKPRKFKGRPARPGESVWGGDDEGDDLDARF